LLGLARGGWSLAQIPATARLPRNKLLLTLRTSTADYRYRVLAYAVGESSRDRPHERRLEATTTYEKGNLQPLPSHRDILLGWDRGREVFVGVDAERLKHGGPTGNASTFLAHDAIDQAATSSSVVVWTRESDLFPPVEYQAYFRPGLIDEYLLYSSTIHGGGYVSTGVRRTPAVVPHAFAAPAAANDLVFVRSRSLRPRRSPSTRLVEAVEAGREGALRRSVSPEELEAALRRKAENGDLGEQHVFAKEQERLRRAGRGDLAATVRLVSRESVSEGYDILSFEADGTAKYVEVKSTEGAGRMFLMTQNEWRVARLRASQYVIARVTKVRSRPTITELRDPVTMDAAGQLHREADGWRVTHV
jgi:hypothetical protein